MRLEVLPQQASEQLPDLDRRFEVKAELNLTALNGQVAYQVSPVSRPYWKTYEPPTLEPNTTTLVAVGSDGQLGAVAVHPHWSGLAAIQDIAVVGASRRSGVGLALVKAAQDWAIKTGYPGICLETQHNNVPACLLYAKAGFKLRGFDAALYSQTTRCKNEIALFWYWFPNGPQSAA